MSSVEPASSDRFDTLVRDVASTVSFEPSNTATVPPQFMPVNVIATPFETMTVPVKPERSPRTFGEPPASSSVPVPVMLLSAFNWKSPPVVLIVPLFSTRQGCVSSSRLPK